MTKKYKYQAFISYRHADNKQQGRQWATWLHQAIETYEVPIDLIGTTNKQGIDIPARIYPVFRDEEELPADANLGTAIVNALDDTHLLIVLCSPRAVQSAYVADEIEYFKKLGRADKVIAVMIDGEPYVSWDEDKLKSGFKIEDECFPIPLQFEYDQNGKRTNQHAEPLAADFRINNNSKPEQGWTSIEAYRQHLNSTINITSKETQSYLDTYQKQQNLMLLKIIAGILGVPLGDLTQRDKAYQLDKAKQKAKVLKRWLTAIFLLALIASGATFFAYYKQQQAIKNEHLANHQKEKAERLLDKVRGNLSFLNVDLREILIQYVPMKKRVLVMHQVDALIEQLPADEFIQEADKITIFRALTNKIDVLAQNIESDPDSVLSLVQKAHDIILTLIKENPNNEELQFFLMKSYRNLGDFTMYSSSSKDAFSAYTSSKDISKKLIGRFPDNKNYQFEMSLSLLNMGQISTRIGENKAAQVYFNDSLNYMQRLINTNMNNEKYLLNIAKIYAEIGNINRYQGQLDESLTAHKKELLYFNKLITLDSLNLKFQSGLAWAYAHLGQILLQLGLKEQASNMFTSEFKIKSQLNTNDPDNLMYQNDLFWSYVGLAKFEVSNGNNSKALSLYSSAHEIINKMVLHDSGNLIFQNNLSLSFVYLGDTQLKLGEVNNAFNSYTRAHSISTKIALLNTNDIDLQLKQVMTQGRIAHWYINTKDFKKAIKAYNKTLKIITELSTKLPHNKTIKTDMFNTYKTLGIIQVTLELNIKALYSFNTALKIIQELVKNDSGNILYLQKLAYIYFQIGTVEFKLNNLPKGIESYLLSLEIDEKYYYQKPYDDIMVEDMLKKYNKLSTTYTEIGDNVQALLFNKKHKKLNLWLKDKKSKKTPSILN